MEVGEIYTFSGFISVGGDEIVGIIVSEEYAKEQRIAQGEDTESDWAGRGTARRHRNRKWAIVIKTSDEGAWARGRVYSVDNSWERVEQIMDEDVKRRYMKMAFLECGE